VLVKFFGCFLRENERLSPGDEMNLDCGAALGLRLPILPVSNVGDVDNNRGIIQARGKSGEADSGSFFTARFPPDCNAMERKELLSPNCAGTI
jgi:hypothetical protein